MYYYYTYLAILYMYKYKYTEIRNIHSWIVLALNNNWKSYTFLVPQHFFWGALLPFASYKETDGILKRRSRINASYLECHPRVDWRKTYGEKLGLENFD